MFQDSSEGAPASSVHAAAKSDKPKFESLRHTLSGSLDAVQTTIKLLHKLNYAEPNDWSKAVTTGQPNEVVVVLRKRIRVA